MNVTANGLRFHAIDEGTGTPVLLLHGFPDTSRLWRRQIDALVGAGFHCVAPNPEMSIRHDDQTDPVPEARR